MHVAAWMSQRDASTSSRPEVTFGGALYEKQGTVEVADQLVTDRVIYELMGKDASARFRFIMDRAEDAVELDAAPVEANLVEAAVEAEAVVVERLQKGGVRHSRCIAL